MPRIPESAVTRRLPAVPIQPVREALQIGGAVTALTEESIELTTRLREADRIDQLTQMSALMEERLADLEFAIEQNPELNTVEAAAAAYAEGAQQIRADLGESNSRAVNQALERQFQRSSLQGSISVRQTAFGRVKDAALANLDTAAVSFARAYATAPDDEIRAEKRALYVSKVELSPHLTEQQKGAQVRAFDLRVDVERVESLLNDDEPELALALLRDEDALPGLDPVHRERFEEQALGMIRGDAVAELDIRIPRGQSTEEEIRKFREENFISSEGMARRIRELDRVNAQLAKDQAGLQRVFGALTGEGFPLDPKDKDDKEGLDLFYRQGVVPRLESLNETQRSDAIVKFVSLPGIGMMPKTLQSEVRGKLRSGTDEQAIEAADIIDRVMAASPRALDDLAPEDISLGLNVAKQIRAGVPEEKALSRAREVEAIPEAGKEVLEARFRDIETKDDIQDRIDELRVRPGVFPLFGSRDIPAQFEGELIGLTEIEYLRNGGDIDLALDVAVLQMDRVWAQTLVDGGPPRMMKYAPEAVYPEFPTVDALSEQLLADVNENAIPQMSMESIRLVPDLKTPRSVPPDYAVELLQDSGEWLPLMQGGLLLRYQFDFATSPEGQRIAEENAQALESAKARRIAVESLRTQLDRAFPVQTPDPLTEPVSTPAPFVPPIGTTIPSGVR